MRIERLSSLLVLLTGLTTGCWVSDERLLDAQDRDGDGYLPTALGGDDCDDDAAAVNPAASELCDDGVDNDCDGRIDDSGLGNRTYYVDADEDGYGREVTALLACTAPPGHVTLVGDCDDGDPARHPAAVDACNGIDDDCDDVVDEDAPPYVQYRDADGDGQGTFTDQVVQCSAVEGYVTTVGDCDDANPTTFVGAADFSCDGIDDNCNGIADEDATFADYLPDDDGDGWGTDEATATTSCTPLAGQAPRGGDCDDANPSVSPGAQDDDCDGVDDDCDGLLDEGAIFLDYYPDADADGWGRDDLPAVASCAPLPNHVPRAGDCDDLDSAINSGANDDNCDTIDNDCDGLPDDDAVFVSYYIDVDLDGWGDDSTAIDSCLVIVDRVTQGGDCAVHDPTIHPGELDVCDGIDNDCSGFADENLPVTLYYDDLDGDGFGDPSTGEVTCAADDGRVLDATDCDDTDVFVNTMATDLCDGIDSDCDGTPNDDAPHTLWFPDADGDGFGAWDLPELRCDVPSGYVTNNADCNDDNPSVSVRTWYRDLDGDGQGTLPNNECVQPPDHASVPGDCDDTDPSIRRGVIERCDDGQDNDCDPTTDCSWSGSLLASEADIVLTPAPNTTLGVLDDVTGDGLADYWRATPTQTHFYVGTTSPPGFSSPGDLVLAGSCALRRIPDLDHDGVPDLQCVTPGSVTLYSGVTQTPLVTYTSAEPGFGDHVVYFTSGDGTVWIASDVHIHRFRVDLDGSVRPSSESLLRVTTEDLVSLAAANVPGLGDVLYVDNGQSIHGLIEPQVDIDASASDFQWDYHLPSYQIAIRNEVVDTTQTVVVEVYDATAGAPTTTHTVFLDGPTGPTGPGFAQIAGQPNEPLTAAPLASPTDVDQLGWALQPAGPLPRTAVMHEAAGSRSTSDVDAWFVDSTSGGTLRLETSSDVDGDQHRDLVFRTDSGALLIFHRRLE